MVRQLSEIEKADLAASVLTIGAFDGVHLGHQRLVRKVIAAARKVGAPAVVLTFFPHPSVVLQGREPTFYLTSPGRKGELLGELGIDVVITQKFNRELSLVPADEYIQRLKDHLGLRQLWIGPDFALGHEREGNVSFLREAQVRYGFTLEVVEPLKVSGEVVSSSRIREALRSGDVARAAHYLGRRFALMGEVKQGANRESAGGIALATLQTWEQGAYPREGVYACIAHLQDETAWQAVAYVGQTETYDEDRARPTVEVHLIDSGGQQEGERMALDFVDRVPGATHHLDVDQPHYTLDRDVRVVRGILEGNAEIR